YFNNMLGYTVIAGTILLIAVYVYSTNFGDGYPNFEYALQSASGFLFTVMIPLLTMKSFAEERRQKTDQLLLTSPLSIGEIVLGKFFGTVSVIGIAFILCIPYPLIFSIMGHVNFLTAYGALLGMFFMSCALCAIGIFISSLTENQIVSAIATLCAMLLLSSLGYIISFIPAAAKTNYVILTFFAVAIVIGIYALTKSFIAAAAFAVVLEGGLILVYRLAPRLLERSASKILSVFSVFGKMSDFVYGMFDIGTMIYYISVAALFLFFTALSVEKRRWS
ncbi:MAG: ABC transporter permease subunit, partial [Clostridia bacterium]|nr:ABC transporter permease subunit [Clostridia bacterium]